VEQYEAHQKKATRNGRSYAAAEALFDLDTTRSIQTMHERNDNINNLDETEVTLPTQGQQLPTDRALEADKNHEDSDDSKRMEDDIQEDLQQTGSDKDRPGEDVARGMPKTTYRSGYTPISVGVRFRDSVKDGAYRRQEANSLATASAAGSPQPSLAGDGG
jgi:hypothetical protein